MAIKYIPQNKKEIEVEGFGKFLVRRYGVNEEFQVEADMRELNELLEKAKNFSEKYKGKKDNEIPVEEMADIDRTQKRVDELNREMIGILKSTITSDDPKAVDKLFTELDRVEIRQIINTALRGAAIEEKANV